MKQYRVIVRVSGMTVTTVVFAGSVLEAQKILAAQFGVNNVVSIPSQIGSCR